MNAIVAVDENWGIGCKGELLFSIPEDLKFFKDLTINKVVVMGHCTLKSLPNSKPLKNRINIVLSRDKDLELDSVMVCNSIDHLIETTSQYDSNDVIVIGGQDIYAQLLAYCSVVYVTKVKGSRYADRHFPNIDEIPHWQIEHESDEKEHDGYKYVFCKYVNVK